MSGEFLPRKYRYLPDRLPRAENVQDLFFALSLKLEHFHPTREYDVKPNGFIALKKDGISSLEYLVHSDFGQASILRAWKTLEKRDGHEPIDWVHGYGKYPFSDPKSSPIRALSIFCATSSGSKSMISYHYSPRRKNARILI